ncbi:MAG TPA: FkbM family methyltransferase [Sandaracinaceae bacterium LLY-WYZ-13_1]|nr:FkbM family methyltransferase [Sandaracinaceae bacterium LLY-WYZ-13_1]
MIELSRDGRQLVFDDEGLDPTNPGRVRGFLLRGELYEEPFLEYIRSLGVTGAYVDVGAFIGTHTVYFGAMCDASYVYAFEPRATPRAELRRNVALNGLESRVRVVEKGLADEPKRVTVRMDRRNWTFDCVRMDDVVSGPVGLIKIDVEGGEIDVLRGATRILEESAPVIFAEALSTEARDELRAYLRSFGYERTGRVFNAAPTYELVHLERGSADQLRRAYAELEQIYERRRAPRATLPETGAEGSRAELDRAARVNRELLHRLESARRSMSFRMGRASKRAWKQAGGRPWRLPRLWIEEFRGSDEILEDARRRAREVSS